MPRYVFVGRVEVVNQSSGGFPEPRFFFREKAWSSLLLLADIVACFLSKALNVVSFLAAPISSSSDSEESEPDKLSSRSRQSQDRYAWKKKNRSTSYQFLKIFLVNWLRPSHSLLQVVAMQIRPDMASLFLHRLEGSAA